MNGDRGDRRPGEARVRGAGVRCAWRRCIATGLVIVGLLAVAAGTVLAYSEWQAQAEPPSSFGPDARAAPLPITGEAVDTEPGLLAEGAELPPMEVVPGPALPETGERLALPYLRSDGNSTEATVGSASIRSDIPRVPSWVDATFPGKPARRQTPSESAVGATPPAPTDDHVAHYPPPPTPSPTATATPEPTATPTPTPYPVAQSAPTHIEIPEIAVDADVVPVGWSDVDYKGQMVRVWNVADYAAGWHQTSVFPGQPGNIVISGHNNIRGEVFRDVVNLEAGDEIILTADSLPYVYVVESKMVIPEKGRPMEERLENNRWIGYFEDERLTLVTCWPYTSNTHRVIVVARPRH